MEASRVHPDVARTIAALAHKQSRFAPDDFVSRALALPPAATTTATTERALALAPPPHVPTLTLPSRDRSQPAALGWPAATTIVMQPLTSAAATATTALTPRDAIALLACGTSFMLAISTLLAQMTRLIVVVDVDDE